MRLQHKVVAACAVMLAGAAAIYGYWPPPYESPTPLAAPNARSPVPSAMNTFASKEPMPQSSSSKTPVALTPPSVSGFARLIAPDATPAMLSQAWELVSECMRAQRLIRIGKQDPSLKCDLPPGWATPAMLDPATTRRMLEARVERVDFGAYGDVSANRAAFEGDRDRWAALVEKAYTEGVARGEPSVMAAEAVTAIQRGDALRAMGQLTEAQAEYRRAAVAAVVNAINTGVVAGVKLDPTQDPRVIAIQEKLPADQRAAVINEGAQLARKWRTS